MTVTYIGMKQAKLIFQRSLAYKDKAIPIFMSENERKLKIKLLFNSFDK